MNALDEEMRALIRENNQMLKEILALLREMNSPQANTRSFLMNYIANKLSEGKNNTNINP